MNLDVVVGNLNRLINEEKNYNSLIEISVGDKIESSVKIANIICPYGKIAVLITQNQYFYFGEEIKKRFIDLGFKPIILILNENSLNNVDCFSTILDLPEDVRLIICADVNLTLISEYYAGLKNLPVIFLITTCNFAHVFFNRFYITENNVKKIFDVKTFRFIIFDFNDISENFDHLKVYAFIQSKIVGLIDYRICCTAYGVPINVKAYELCKKSIEESFNLLSLKDKNEVLFLSLLKVCVADYITDGAIYYLSSSNCAKMYYLGNETGGESEEFFFSNKICSLYNTFFCRNNIEITQTPNYNNIANNMSNGFGLNFIDVSKDILSQINIYNKKEKELRNLISSLKKEINSIDNYSDKAYNIYSALGGGCNIGVKDFTSALKSAGDFCGCFNGITYLRELGVIELV